MDISAILDRVFHDQTAQAPVLTLSHDSNLPGWEGIVAHTVSEVIYSPFDRVFADYVYATTGQPMPRARVETVLLDGRHEILRRSVSGCPTVLDALIQIGTRAAGGEVRHFRMSPGDLGRHLRGLTDLDPRRLDAAHFETMAVGAALIDEIADSGHCRVTATLDGASVQGPGGAGILCEIDFGQALVTFPPREGGESMKLPLLNFAASARERPALAARLRETQEAMGQARRAAVEAFGAACDAEVTRLGAALQGRRIEGRSAEVAGELVDRLIAAFGQDMRGLSPHARLVALDWLEAGVALRRITHGMAA